MKLDPPYTRKLNLTLLGMIMWIKQENLKIPTLCEKSNITANSARLCQILLIEKVSESS